MKNYPLNNQPTAQKTVNFTARISIEQVEEGTELDPKFDIDGL